MSSGHVAVRITIISEENLSEFCPETFPKYLDTIIRYYLDEDNVVRFLQGLDSLDSPEVHDDDIETVEEELRLNWSNLQKDFKEKTTIPGEKHLTLEIGYHDPDNSNCYDDITGVYYQVFGVYTKSPAARKINHLLEDCGFVEFG